MTRTYWLSFTDPDRPEGDRFLGVAVVDVTEQDAEAIKPELPPQAQPGAEWIAAAMRRAWAAGCNPGGNVSSYNITDTVEDAVVPRNLLLSKADLHALGVID